MAKYNVKETTRPNGTDRKDTVYEVRDDSNRQIGTIVQQDTEPEIGSVEYHRKNLFFRCKEHAEDFAFLMNDARAKRLASLVSRRTGA